MGLGFSIVGAGIGFGVSEATYKPITWTVTYSYDVRGLAEWKNRLSECNKGESKKNEYLTERTAPLSGKGVYKKSFGEKSNSSVPSNFHPASDGIDIDKIFSDVAESLDKDMKEIEKRLYMLTGGFIGFLVGGLMGFAPDKKKINQRILKKKSVIREQYPNEGGISEVVEVYEGDKIDRVKFYDRKRCVLRHIDYYTWQETNTKPVIRREVFNRRLTLEESFFGDNY
mgnify:CR=1 FL=1